MKVCFTIVGRFSIILSVWNSLISGKLDDHIENLRTFARSTGGLIDDDIRRIVWPVLARNLYKYDHEGPSEPELDDVRRRASNSH